MKPIFDECTLKWRVQGLGTFDTPQEAWNAIRDNEKTHIVNFLVNREMLNEIRALAKERGISVSELVRQAIEREVNNDEG